MILVRREQLFQRRGIVNEGEELPYRCGGYDTLFSSVQNVLSVLKVRPQMRFSKSGITTPRFD